MFPALGSYNLETLANCVMGPCLMLVQGRAGPGAEPFLCPKAQPRFPT